MVLLEYHIDLRVFYHYSKDNKMSWVESILNGRRRHLLPEETLEEIIKHAKMVKNAYPKYDYTKREDVISYCVESLSGEIMYIGAIAGPNLSNLCNQKSTNP